MGLFTATVPHPFFFWKMARTSSRQADWRRDAATTACGGDAAATKQGHLWRVRRPQPARRHCRHRAWLCRQPAQIAGFSEICLATCPICRELPSPLAKPYQKTNPSQIQKNLRERPFHPQNPLAPKPIPPVCKAQSRSHAQAWPSCLSAQPAPLRPPPPLTNQTHTRL